MCVCVCCNVDTPDGAHRQNRTITKKQRYFFHRVFLCPDYPTNQKQVASFVEHTVVGILRKHLNYSTHSIASL